MASDAVIFIPGIKGTKLVETNCTPFDTIWSGIQTNFESIQNLELTFGKNGRYYDERKATIIEAGEIEELAYGEFLKDLKTDGRPVFIFNYDWRFSAADSGARLSAFMDYLVEKSEAMESTTKFKKFDIITHSLGNFVVRNYIKNNGFNRIERIVFTVPPFLGSLDIVSAALVGEGFFPGVKAKFRKLVRTFPGALELLPNYLGASHFTPTGKHSFFNFNHWQANVTNPEKPLYKKFKLALADAKKVVNGELADLAKLEPEERSRILVIARDGYETLQSLTVTKDKPDEEKNFVDLENACRNEQGDGRVPHVSSCNYYESIMTCMVQDAFWARDYKHGFVLKDERVQKLVNRFLFKNGTFDYKVHGSSVKRVVGLNKEIDNESKLPYWQPVLD